MITAEQKLTAIEIKYYTDFNWEPKEGDYYTILRNDDEVFQIIKITDDEISIQQFETDYITTFKKKEFYSDFHERRLYLHDNVWSPS